MEDIVFKTLFLDKLTQKEKDIFDIIRMDGRELLAPNAEIVMVQKELFELLNTIAGLRVSFDQVKAHRDLLLTQTKGRIHAKGRGVVHTRQKPGDTKVDEQKSNDGQDR